MTEDNNSLLPRYYRAAHRLRDDLKRAIYMEMYRGMGDTAVRTYRGLHEGVMRETDDPFVMALALEELDADMNDKAKIGMVSLLTGQLLAYLEDVLHIESDED